MRQWPPTVDDLLLQVYGPADTDEGYLTSAVTNIANKEFESQIETPIDFRGGMQSSQIPVVVATVQIAEQGVVTLRHFVFDFELMSHKGADTSAPCCSLIAPTGFVLELGVHLLICGIVLGGISSSECAYRQGRLRSATNSRQFWKVSKVTGVLPTERLGAASGTPSTHRPLSTERCSAANRTSTAYTRRSHLQCRACPAEPYRGWKGPTGRA